MNLFDNINRDYIGYRKHPESSYSFLNRSARPEYKQVRDLLEQWFHDYPTEYQNDLYRRFRSGKDHNYCGAFLELYCYALLRLHDFIIELHPFTDDASKSTHPDFLVRSTDTSIFYIEATVAMDSDAESANQGKLQQLRDTLNIIDSANFKIGFEIESESRQSIPTSKIRAILQNWLQTLDPDEISERLKTQSHNAFPAWTWDRDGWNITFFAIPKPPEARENLASETFSHQISAARWVGSQNNS